MLLVVQAARADVAPRCPCLQIEGVVETNPGVRSCMIEYDQRRISLAKLMETIELADSQLPSAKVSGWCRARPAGLYVLPSGTLFHDMLPKGASSRWLLAGLLCVRM